MRIAIVGSACQGKTTLINDFLKKWPSYKRSNESYRDLIKKEQVKLNKEVNKEGQWKILNCLIDDLQQTQKSDNIIFDRCPLDNIVYSLWAEDKQSSDIDKDFIKECIPLVQESMKALDIILFLPITRVAPVITEKKNNREIDDAYIKEIDNIFKMISHNYARHGVCPFLASDDRPPIIEIFGSPEERIELLKLYLNEKGDLIEDQTSILDSENIKSMEDILKANKSAHYDEKYEQEIRNKIILGD